MASEVVRELLRQKAAHKKNPEFHAAQTELAQKLEWAGRMRDAGRLTKGEFNEFEAHLTSQYMEALPMDDYAAMRNDGRWDELETIASHDRNRNVYDVRNERSAIERKITESALDEAYAAQLIDEKTYLAENRKLLGKDRARNDDDRKQRILDADDNKKVDDVVLDIFFERNIAPEPEPEPGRAPRLPDSIKSKPADADDSPAEMEAYVEMRKAQNAAPAKPATVAAERIVDMPSESGD